MTYLEAVLSAVKCLHQSTKYCVGIYRMFCYAQLCPSFSLGMADTASIELRVALLATATAFRRSSVCCLFQCMKHVAAYIEEQNRLVFVPQGLMLVNPANKGLRHVSFRLAYPSIILSLILISYLCPGVMLSFCCIIIRHYCIFYFPTGQLLLSNNFV